MTSCLARWRSMPIRGTTGDQSAGATACWGDLSKINVDSTSYRCLIHPPTLPWLRKCSYILVPTPILPTPTPTAVPPTDKIVRVSAGEYTTCALTDGGDVRCTGRNAAGETDPPANVRLDTISVGRYHACGLSHYGEHGKDPANITSNVVCWGDNYYGQATVPDGAFTVVAAGALSNCGVKIDGSIHCWGYSAPPNWGLIDGAPTATNFVDVKVAHSSWPYWKEQACALADDGDVTCWGPLINKTPIPTPTPNPDAGPNATPVAVPPEHHKFKSISVGESAICGIIADGDTRDHEADGHVAFWKENAITCWGWKEADNTATDPEDRPTKDLSGTAAVIYQ